MSVLPEQATPWPSGTALFPVFQPIVDAAGTAIGFEALARGCRGDAEVSADTLFSWAFAHGATQRLDRHLVDLAVRDAAPWLGSRLLFVNMAPTSWSSAGAWLDLLLTRLGDVGISPAQVVVELHEKQYAPDLAALARLLQDGRTAGVKIALDDVLGDNRTDIWAAALRPEFIKLDGSVVRSLNEPAGQLSLSCVARTAARVGATVIAEHVETQSQRLTLQESGVNLVQGWLTGGIRRGWPQLRYRTAVHC